MSLPTLYKATKTGAIQQWSITVDGATYTTSSGKVDGVMTPHKTVCKGKNIGRANETTAEQQAIKEAKAKQVKQLDKGYTEDPSGVIEVTLPPLAKKVQDNLKKINWPWIGLDKLDGVRCTMFFKDGEVVFQSRGGKNYPVIQEIADGLINVWFDNNPQLVVDGELYCHGMHLEDITSAVKKHNEDTAKINFYVFDIYNPDEPNRTYEQRYLKYYTELCSRVVHNRVFPITSYGVVDEGAMQEYHDAAVKKGYEGIVLRDPDSLFKFNYRTDKFLKLKVAIDEEFKVVGFEKDKNGGGIPVCEVEVTVDKKGNPVPEGTMETFKANFKGTHEFRKLLWDKQDDYIGRHLTVSYEKRSKYGVPAKPIGKAFRDVDSQGSPLT